MKQTDRRDKDLEYTIELPISNDQDHHIKKKDPKRIVFPLVSKIGITLAVILSIILFAHAIYIYVFHDTISMIDHTALAVSGVNGSGTVDPSFHPERAAIQEIKERSDSKEAKELINSISCSFEPSNNLSNGMEITYACSYNAALSDALDIHFKDTEKSYIVMGLADQEAIDPFENFEVERDQTDASLELIPDEKYTDLGIEYSYTYDSDHSIKVTIDYDENAMYENGYYIPETDREKSIDIPQVLTLEQIPQETLQSIEASLLTKVESELYACDFKITFGKEILSTFDPVFETFQKNDDGSYDAVITVNNIYSLTLSKYYHFTIKYHGYFICDTDGTITFQTKDQHGCAYDGFGSEYEIQKSDPF